MHGLAAPDRSLTVAARICMLFNSFTFAAFFALVYGLYLLSMRRLRLQNTILLAASYVFYGWWDWRFLGLIVLSTVTDFVCGWAIDRRQRPRSDAHWPADEIWARARCGHDRRRPGNGEGRGR